MLGCLSILTCPKFKQLCPNLFFFVPSNLTKSCFLLTETREKISNHFHASDFRASDPNINFHGLHLGGDAA